MEEDVMTIREMCEAFDVTPRALRFYESKELLFPIREGQKRLFTRRDRARLKLILRGKRYGVSLEDMRQILDLYDTDDGETGQLQRAIAVARERMANMKSEREQLQIVMDDLADQISVFEQSLQDKMRASAA
jgi:DNA-binding transcriptional MerR regulator